VKRHPDLNASAAVFGWFSTVFGRSSTQGTVEFGAPSQEQGRAAKTQQPILRPPPGPTVLWSPEVGMEVVAYSVRQSRARGLGEPPLFPRVSVLSEYIKLTYHPRVVLLLHSTLLTQRGSPLLSPASTLVRKFSLIFTPG
jgi:hypothetical protein